MKAFGRSRNDHELGVKPTLAEETLLPAPSETVSDIFYPHCREPVMGGAKFSAECCGLINQENGTAKPKDAALIGEEPIEPKASNPNREENQGTLQAILARM